MKKKKIHELAIWMIVVTFGLAACCPPEILPPEPPVKLDPLIWCSVRDVTKTSALFVAEVVPNNEEVAISFEIEENGSNGWVRLLLDEKVNGDTLVTKTLAVDTLKPGTSYKFRALANEIVSEDRQFITKAIIKGRIKSFEAKEDKMTTAIVKVVFVPSTDDSVTLSFKYWVEPDSGQSVSASDQKNIVWPEKFFGSDEVSLSLELDELKINSNYVISCELANLGGVVNKDTSFLTYAAADYDGNLYHAVTIGQQTWLKENFRGTHFANGDPIPYVLEKEDWVSLLTIRTPAYCWYNNNPALGKIYGGLYTWQVGTDPRGLIVGYKAPSGLDFIELDNYYGYNDGGSGYLITDASGQYWKENLFSKKPNNESGFSALPNGARNWETGNCLLIGELATFWTTGDMNSEAGEVVTIGYSNCSLGISTIYKKNLGCGLRLIKE